MSMRAYQPTYKSFAMVCLMVFNISLSAFYFGYTFIYYAAIPAETVSKLYHIGYDNALAEGLLNGAISIGGLGGSFLSSPLLHHLSRRNSLLLLDFCTIIVGILIYIPNFYVFLALRVVQGICVGAYSSIMPLIIKEISPLEISGMMGNFSQLNLTIGVLFGQFLSFILKKWTGDESGEQFWIIIFGFTFVTQIIQIAVLLFVFPYETPKYLLLNNQKQQCQKLIQTIYKQEYFELIYKEKIADIAHDHQEVEDDDQEQANSDLVIPHHKVSPMAALVATLLTSLQQLSGINAMILYANEIAQKSFTGEIVQIIPMLMNVVIFIFNCISFLLLDKIGRRPILVGGFAVGSISCALITYAYSSPTGSSNSTLILFGIIVYMMAYGVSLGPIGWAYLPQIISPSAMPYVVACNWFSYGIVAIFFPILTEDFLGGNPCLLFLIFTCACIIATVFNWKYMIETKDKTEKAIRLEYQALKLC